VIDSISQIVSIPVLVCAYSRRIEFQNMLTSLVASGCKKIYINIDGSNYYETQLEQESMRDFVAKIRLDSPNTHVIARQSKDNLGAAVSIISSLDWFFSQEEVGLIFEDDLEFDQSVFQFSDWALTHFANDPAVWIVAGSNFFSEHAQLQETLHMTNYPVTWGWGTWREKWMTMRSCIVEEAPRTKTFNSNYVDAFWTVGARRSKAGFVDAWDIPLAEAMNRIGSKTVVPPFNLVRNIGFSDLASNTHELRFPLDRAIDSGIEDWNPNVSRENSILEGEKINSLYETYVYGIGKRHLLSPLLSKFDAIRFRKTARGSLSSRLNKIDSEGFIDF
jgi:hypothetical protein